MITRPRVVVPALLALLALQIVAFAGVRSDDAFITYRYAQNLATGQGPVFNPGDRLLGSTSPGQMLIAAAGYVVAGRDHLPALMSVLGCVAWSAQAVALYLLLGPALGRGALVPAFALLIGGTRAQAWVPLETNLVAAVVLFAFVAAARARWYVAATCAAVATVLRPDAWLAALILAGACSYQLRMRALGPAASFVALAAPWPAFATLYYGTPLPQSALAKYQRATFTDYLQHTLSYPSETFLPGPVPALQIAGTLALGTAGAWLVLRRSPGLALFIGYGIAHAAAYLVLRPFTVHAWHLYPWVLVLTALAWSALVGSAQVSRRAVAVAAGAVTAALLVAQLVRYAESVQTLAGSYWSGERQATYEDVARYLSEHAHPADWFASVEVGTIAYYTNLSAFDFGGLVTRPTQRLDEHPVRFLVVDRLYMRPHMPVPPVYRAQHGAFFAVIYRTR